VDCFDDAAAADQEVLAEAIVRGGESVRSVRSVRSACLPRTVWLTKRGASEQATVRSVLISPSWKNHEKQVFTQE
jgi:hypothetical protein